MIAGFFMLTITHGGLA